MNKIIYCCAIVFGIFTYCMQPIFITYHQKFEQSVTGSIWDSLKEKQKTSSLDNINEYSYQKKTWVTDGASTHGGMIFPLSLIITKIGDEMVEGHVTFNGMAEYNSDGIWEDSCPEFRGTVHNNKADCMYIDKKGKLCSLELTFYDEHWIQAMIDGDENQSYQLRPYNVADKYFINEPVWVETELSGWGIVKLFYANSLSNHTIPEIMLLNDEGDILYNFKGGTYCYQSGSEVLDIIVRDMNQDGLDDIEIITCGFDGLGKEKWCDEWYYYQREDGMFICDETGFVTVNHEKER